MSKDKRTSNKLKINLRENGIHSLWRGIESFEEYDRTQNEMLLKDAIMFLHHGVELLMKEVLVKHSPFLIFEDLKDASKKQRQADSSGVGIFFLERAPKTVTFEEAINRVDAFIRPPELTDDLQTSLSELNRLRNQLEHYAIEADKEKITQLLADLRKPLLELFEAQIGGIKRLQTPKVIQAWDKVQDSAKFYSKLEKEVFEVVRQFNGQKVPGRLFNTEGEFTLPVFERVLANAIVTPEEGFKYEADILGENKNNPWVVEVKAGRHIDIRVMDQLAFRSQVFKATVWLVAFSDLSKAAREAARKRGILITGASEWQELKRLVEDNSSAEVLAT
jgi:hypothetical protein